MKFQQLTQFFFFFFYEWELCSMLVEFIISYGTNQTDYGSNFVFDLLCGSVYYYVLNLNGYIYHPK